MAEEAKKKADAPAGPAAEKPSDKKDAGKEAGHGAHGGGGGGLLSKTPVLLGGVMLIEAVVLFAGFKFIGGAPKQSQGAELAATEETAPAPAAEHGGGEAAKPASGEHGAAPAAEHGGSAGPAKPLDKKRSIEIEVLKKVQFPNKVSGRIFFFDVEIYAMTKAENKEKVEGLIAERKNLITDRIRTIIAQIDPEKLGGGSLEPGLETLRRQVKYQLDEIVGEGMIDEVLVPRCIPFRADY